MKERYVMLTEAEWRDYIANRGQEYYTSEDGIYFVPELEYIKITYCRNNEQPTTTLQG